MDNFSLGEVVKQVVRDNGDPVLMHTNYCKTHQESSEDCKACESFAGCRKANLILFYMLVLEVKGSSNPLEFVQQLLQTGNKVQEILKEDNHDKLTLENFSL